MIKESYVDVLVRVRVVHGEHNPEEVIANCNYEFAIEPDEGEDSPLIKETEILETRVAGDCDEHGILWRSDSETGRNAEIFYDQDLGSAK